MSPYGSTTGRLELRTRVLAMMRILLCAMATIATEPPHHHYRVKLPRALQGALIEAEYASCDACEVRSFCNYAS